MSPFLKKDQKEGETLRAEGRVGSLLFSEGTYQVEVKDPAKKEPFWPFLQLDREGKVLDCFCTCGSAEKKRSCPHLAAAYLSIFQGKPEPLHVRFRDSLWNQICQIASRRHGYETNTLHSQQDGRYEAVSTTGKLLFYIQPLTAQGKQRFKEIYNQRTVETEETSLKFSNLSSDELALWRQGRPSHQLRYELSFWSDLGKWWMLLQDAEQSYQISFPSEAGHDKELPKWIKGRFKDVEWGCYIAEVNWSQVIPSLHSVNSPLQAFEFSHQMIKKITYNPDEQAFILDFATAPTNQHTETQQISNEENKIEIGDWVYIPKRGFFPARIDPLLKESVIPKAKISSVLHKHAKIIQKYLVGTEMVRHSIKAQYTLEFDQGESLCIRCYALEPGDLHRPRSCYFGPWVYVQDKGFYLLEERLFEASEKIIPKPLVSDFINRHRLWLSSVEGFQPHISSLETALSFTVSQEGILRFETKLDFSEESELIDLGEWVYIKERGFYSKMTGRTGTLLRPGISIKPDEISSFIHHHKEELEQIEGFFSAQSCLEKTGLNLSLNEEERIVVRPDYFFSSPHHDKNTRLFGDFTYVDKEGFYEIPPKLRLPEGYTKEKRIEPAAEPYFVGYEIDLLEPYILSIDPRLKKPKQLVLKVNQIKKDVKSKTGMWVVSLEYQSETGTVDAIDMWKGVNQQDRYLFTSAGLITLRQQPRFNWLKLINKKKWLKGGKQLRLTTLEWLKLCVFEDIKDPTGSSKEAVTSRKLLAEFRTMQAAEFLDLSGLESHLRPYQEVAVRWLWFLYCHGLSGLLCDEMGLGKTHQAMGLLAAVFNARTDPSLKCLVVCPTSVIFHWEDLLRRFLPKGRVCVFYGAQRTLRDFQDKADILLTSYGTLRSEKATLSDLFFEVAVFDEIQIAKNSHSQTHKALKSIGAKMRLGLTGTPMENRLLELKALFDVVVPSYMPSEAVFRELFVNPIEKTQDPEKKMLLARLIKPFILRRRKADVLLELPEKIETIAYCSLSEQQRELYRQTFLEKKEPLMQELADKQKPTPFVHIFSLLSTLKQICDHPSLVLKDTDYRKHQSGKWDLFVELLQEVRESNQKLVVFSQYLGMLDIIESYLREEKIGFTGIRGSTRDRKTPLQTFRDDPKCEVFVASLQAAGVGIDLVSASVVIHYDRWWNPAKENQATDRVHRIGQNHGVQVFKMVTRHSVEEHIHQLIEKKLKLMEGVIGFDEHDQIKGLEREELLHLLKLLNDDLG